MQTGFEIDGESELPGVSTIRSMNSALPEVKETGSQYQSSRSVLRMNGIVYIILEEYNTYYEVCEQDNSDLHNNSLLEYRNRRRYLGSEETYLHQ